MTSRSPHDVSFSTPTDEEIGRHYEDASLARNLARAYEEPTRAGDFYRDRMARIGQLLAEETGALLDAGCGTGQMLRHLSQTRPGAFTLIGLDRSSSVIDVARTIVGDDSSVQFVAGRMEDMPFSDAVFDVVLAMGSLEYVRDVERAVGEIARVLRRGGLAICTMQNPHSPYRLWDAKIWGLVRGQRGTSASPIVRRLTRRALCGILSAVGLEPQVVEAYGHYLLVPPLDAILPRIRFGRPPSLRDACHRRLGLLASDYIVVARRMHPRATSSTRAP
jgi:ubiquinone/menaquinone biosynthesis C-methylase UbiE